MPACMSCRRSVDCLTALLGMNGRAATAPMRSITGTTAALADAFTPAPPGSWRSKAARSASWCWRRRLATGSLRNTTPLIEYASNATVAKRKQPKRNSWEIWNITSPIRLALRLTYGSDPGRRSAALRFAPAWRADAGRFARSHSHLHRHDLLDAEQPQRLEDQRDQQDVKPLARVEQHPRVLRVDQVQDHVKDQRQHEQDVADHPALRGDRLDVLLQANSRADHVGDVGQHLGEVAARGALNQ